MSAKLNPYRFIFSNWLLRLTLLWSVFLFSGYADSDYLTLPTTTTTELVEAKKTATSFFVFQKNTTQLAVLVRPFLFLNAFKVSLNTYNQLQQVKLLASIKKGYAYPFSYTHLPTKTIPTDSKEATSLYFAG